MPLATLSQKLYAPKTNAPLAPFNPMTSDCFKIMNFEVFCKTRILRSKQSQCLMPKIVQIHLSWQWGKSTNLQIQSKTLKIRNNVIEKRREILRS